jgi:hypothetical protein
MESGTPVKKFTPMSCIAWTKASLSIMVGLIPQQNKKSGAL